MAYELDPSIQVFSVDTGRLPTETYELIERLRDRYPGLDLQLLSPEGRQVQAMVSLHGPNLFYTQVEKRLLCCNVRKVQPLTRHLATLDAWITGLRRDQWATRTTSARSRSTTTTARSSSSIRSPSGRRKEVWDYVRERDVRTTRSTTAATRPSAARRARARSPLGKRGATAAGGGR